MGKNNCCGSTGFIVIVVNLLLFGVIFLVAGLILSQGDVLSEIIRNKIDQDMMLKPGSSAYRNWLKPVLPIYMQFFVFNLTNPEEFFSGTEKPAVQQRGPYSYKEIRRNLVLNWSVDDNEVKFKPYRAYVFDPETSCETCNDTKDSITTVNIPLMSMITFMESRLDVFGKGKDCNSLLNYAIDLVEPKPRLFHTLTVNDMIWGYTDPLLKLLYDMQNSSVVECPVPEGFNPFVQLQQNNSFSGVSVINSGRNDIDLVGQYIMWKNNRSLSWWHNEYANMINGTDGTQTKPHLTEDDLIYYTFSPDICRSMSFLYEEMTEIIGIKLRRYVPPDESSDPDNNGFCVPPNCPPAGLLNISCCLPSNPPVVISPPHFYQCNKSLLDTVDGLHPSKDLHGSHIDVEPITGLTMNANKRIQFNIAMHPSSLLEVTKGSFNPVFLPVMYINEKAELDKDNADKFKNKVYIPILLTEVLEWGLVILGSVLIIVAILLFTCRRGRNGFLQMADEHAPLVGKGK